MIQFIEGLLVGGGLMLVLEFYLVDKHRKEEKEFRLDILRSVFIDNPLPLIADYDSFQSPEAIGLRVQLETGEILYGRADGMKVREIDPYQWAEMGGVEALAHMNEMEDELDDEEDDSSDAE
jgi:hypothetical protein